MVLVVLAGVLALIGWLAFGGGSGKKAVSGKGPGPAQSITPGPSGSGNGGSSDGSPTGAPSGGASKGAGGGSGGSGSGGSGSGSPGSGPVSVSSGSGTGESSGGSASGSTGGSVAAGGTATMALPVCSPDNLLFSLTSTQASYTATQWPVFQLQISNNGGPACRTDLAADAAVVQVSSSSNAHVWSSADCPVSTAARWYPLGGSDGVITANFQWARTTSAPGCTPGAGGAAAAPGNYLVKVSINGATISTSSFTLAPFGS